MAWNPILVGDVALVDSDIASERSVFSQGEYWTRAQTNPFSSRERVGVTQVSDLVVRVRQRSEGSEESNT